MSAADRIRASQAEAGDSSSASADEATQSAAAPAESAPAESAPAESAPAESAPAATEAAPSVAPPAAAAPSVSTDGATSAERARHQTIFNKMRDHFASQPRVRVRLQNDQVVQVNGYTFAIKGGEPVEVPEQIAEMLQESGLA